MVLGIHSVFLVKVIAPFKSGSLLVIYRCQQLSDKESPDEALERQTWRTKLIVLQENPKPSQSSEDRIIVHHQS